MKIAVFFPGIGYKFEKPLLKETIRIAQKKGFEILLVDYNGFPENAKQELDLAVNIALSQAEKILEKICWQKYEEIVFIGKSIGTAVCSIYPERKKIECKKILLTPIPQTFSIQISNAIAFYGTSDPWITNDQVIAGCKTNSIPLTVYDGMNHSLICSDEQKNFCTLKDVLEKCESFITK